MNKLKFRACYIERGYTQNSMANALDMTVQTLIRKQRDDAFTVKDVQKICKVLNLTSSEMEAIFFDKDFA